MSNSDNFQDVPWARSASGGKPVSSGGRSSVWGVVLAGVLLTLLTASLGYVLLRNALRNAASQFEADFARVQAEVAKSADEEIKRIQLKVALDAMEQFKIAARSGTPMDAYIQAGAVSAALLQLKDEEKYREWKKIEAKAARRAGIKQ